MRLRAALLATIALVAASCSSGGSDGADVTQAPVSAVESPDTEPTPTEAPDSEPVDSEPVDTEPADPPSTEPADVEEPADPPTDDDSDPAALPDEYVGYVSDVYADDAVWMCRGGKVDDVCDRDLDATAVFLDGSTEPRPHERAVDPPIDCFYVYPTVSTDQSANSDLIADEGAEIGTTLSQAARLTGACRVFAPIYRQVTIPALFDQVESDQSNREIAYADVLDSFRHFIANDSDGRPFVLVGHSQGAGILAAMIEAEIDGVPSLRDRMVSAILLGASVREDQFDTISACSTLTDVNCVVSYASFRSTAPPVDGSFFGASDGQPALCVNPVDPSVDGPLISTPYFSIVNSIGELNVGAQFDEGVELPEITTEYVTFPDFISLRCVDDGTYGYLELAISADIGPRRDDIAGDLTPQWGMHLVDANIAMGDLVTLVQAQSDAFTG